ncbi:hypothetical protein G3578_19100 [Brevibacillus sp. SYP-B805]|uniref:hypothetical protein n=1 Tax=Brevibacillus sp. SYP-B805 TaxID=1578199 RepID=UPI0013E9E597|nr:hypothetical protein [Brevibacillus sp. SYP-B805]NGQ97249.1 hypothetical protein [Brevibacillus sp. SYP-B805]
MNKRCSRCGSEMRIMLRNVVYRSKVRINHVPVHVCQNEYCSHSQVVDIIKDDLKKLMSDLGTHPTRQAIEFKDISEFSNALVLVANEPEGSTARIVIEERINELLDLFLLAQSLGDEDWIMDIRKRLVEIQYV